jgi:hypothetical protein
MLTRIGVLTKPSHHNTWGILYIIPPHRWIPAHTHTLLYYPAPYAVPPTPTPTLTLSPDLTGLVANSEEQALMPILSPALPSVWGGGIVGPVPAAAVFPPRVQDVCVAVELLLAVAFVHLVVRAA